jgi:hypothetical protein
MNDSSPENAGFAEALPILKNLELFLGRIE